MDWEWPYWRLIEKGFPISEVDKWDLEDIYKVLDMITMANDYELAHAGYIEKTRDK